MRRSMHSLLLAGSLALAALASPALSSRAEAQAPRKLFVSLTTDDPWRAQMALTFAEQVRAKGHPVTVWLVNEGVRLAAKEPGEQAKPANAQLAALAGKGATVLVCPGCMKQAGLAESALMAGVKLSTPDVTIPALMDPQTQSISW
jgi:sulfur relay (sulfurtransferase) complex TusBCD TusD component (DsrE family)